MKQITSKILIALTLIMFMSHLSFGQSPKMILVEGGGYTMGSDVGVAEERPAHKVTVSSFYICEHELTVGEYKKYISATGKTLPAPPDRAWLDSHTHTKMLYASSSKGWWGWNVNFPIHNVNWYDAIGYCNWLSGKESLTKCYKKNADGGWDLLRSANGYRLPTEAEWEFAARGGNKTAKTKYSGSNSINTVAWYDETSKLAGPKAIKSKKANELGIYDMSGNVWEWCSDYYQTKFYATSPEADPFCNKSMPYRSLRGGSWHYRAELATVTSRDGPKAAKTNYNYGFRLAKNK